MLYFQIEKLFYFSHTTQEMTTRMLGINKTIYKMFKQQCKTELVTFKYLPGLYTYQTKTTPFSKRASDKFWFGMREKLLMYEQNFYL